MIEFFSFKGRIRRSEYLVSIVVLNVIFGLVCLFINMLVDEALKTLAWVDAVVVEFINLLSLLCYSWILLAQCAKRLHDIGLSGWFSILALIPFATLILFIIDGQPRENKYGPDPKLRDLMP